MNESKNPAGSTMMVSLVKALEFRASDGSAVSSSSTYVRALAAALAAFLLPYGWKVIRKSLLMKKKKTIVMEKDGKVIEVTLPPTASPGYLETMTTLAASEPHETWLKFAHDLGSFIFRIKLPYPGVSHVMVVGEPAVARQILSDRTSCKPVLLYAGAGLLCGGDQNIMSIPSSDHHRWKHARKSVAHAFSSFQVKRMLQVCKEKTGEWIDGRLQKEILLDSDGIFEPNSEFLHLTMKIICKAAFEYDIDEEEIETFLVSIRLGLAEVTRQMSNPLRKPFSFLFPEVKQTQEALDKVNQLAFRIMDKFRKKQQEEEGSTRDDSTTTQKPIPTVLRCLVEDDDYEDDHDRVRDMILLLIAGHDTTAHSLSWTLLELAQHKNIADQLRAELKACKTEEDRVNLPLLKYVVKEMLRLHPLVSVGSARVTAKDFYFTESFATGGKEAGGSTYWIPKNSLIFPSPYLTQRHPSVFEDPNEFQPSRWSKYTTTKDRTADVAFMPFSAGPRACVGMPLAYAEMHYVLARLVMNYDFEVIDPGFPELKGSSLRPTNLKLKAISIQTK